MSQPKRILSLDDEPAMLDILSQMLTQAGYEVLTTASAEEFFNILKRQRVDLVLLDLQMPERDGLDVYREYTAHQHTPVLFVTGYRSRFAKASPDVVELWQTRFAEGTTDILYKPFTGDQLVAKVHSLIG